VLSGAVRFELVLVPVTMQLATLAVIRATLTDCTQCTETSTDVAKGDVRGLSSALHIHVYPGSAATEKLVPKSARPRMHVLAIQTELVAYGTS